METCPVPSNISIDEAVSNIRMTLQVHPQINGVVTIFNAYGNFKRFPQRIKEGCERTGVKCIQPKGGKDSVDRAILRDMFLFALDNPPPAYIMLISGDDSFYDDLRELGQRGYTVILAMPSRAGVSSDLRNAGNFVWDWPNLPKSLRSLSCPNGLSETSARQVNSYKQNDSNGVKPGDVDGLKRQLVSLLISSGGHLRVDRLARKYQQTFKRPLVVRDYNHRTLWNLLEDMSDEIELEHKPNKPKTAHIKKCLNKLEDVEVDLIGQRLEVFREELKELLACHCFRMRLSFFETVYEYDYGKSLDYKSLGVGNLEELLGKMAEVAVLFENKNKVRYVMSARYLKQNREIWKLEVPDLLCMNSGMIALKDFDYLYKDYYTVEMNYDECGVSNLEELCELYSDIYVVEDGKIYFRQKSMYSRWVVKFQ